MKTVLFATVLTVTAITRLATTISSNVPTAQAEKADNTHNTSINHSTTTTPLDVLTAQTEKADNKVKFVCGESFDPDGGNRLPTTFAWTPRGKIAVVRWATKDFPNYPPERRCQEVSPRFQAAYDNGTLNLLTNGTMNNQPVICTTQDVGDGCNTLLVTLRPNDDSRQFLEQIVSLLNGEKVGPPKHTNQRYVQIDIEEFLQTAPVEE
ncbi:MAG: COP23 domain-containing protein [Cyanobacteria bacterium P01_G01_bin.49]